MNDDGQEWVPIGYLIDDPRAVHAPIVAAHTKPEPQVNGGAMPQPKILLILKCGHIVMGTAGVAKFRCNRCDAIVPIKDVHVWEWHMKCLEHHCKLSRWTGLSSHLAGQIAREHMNRTRTHIAVADYEINPTAERVRSKLIRDKIIDVRIL